MPAGQIGGPLLMIRQLSQRGTPAPDAAAAIIISTTFQTFAQIVFALVGVALLGERRGIPFKQRFSDAGAGRQRCPRVADRGLLSAAASWSVREDDAVGAAFRGNRDWSLMPGHADAIDGAVKSLHGHSMRVTASFGLSLLALGRRHW